MEQVKLRNTCQCWLQLLRSKLLRFAAFLTALFIFIYSSAWSAPPKPRPLAGIGILALHPVSLESGGAPSLTVYREPGVNRISDLEFSELPSMAPAIKASPGVSHLAVTRKKGDWVKIIFDDSGREGWLEMERGWEFREWSKYLRGGEVKLLNGLRKELYQLKATASAQSQSIGAISKEKKLLVVELDGFWMLVLVDFENSGWLRWKDDDGRLLISVEK
jgi:hypothetical protein